MDTCRRNSACENRDLESCAKSIESNHSFASLHLRIELTAPRANRVSALPSPLQLTVTTCSSSHTSPLLDKQNTSCSLFFTTATMMAFVGSGIGCVKRVLPAGARRLHNTCPAMLAKGDKMPMDGDLMTMGDGGPTPIKTGDIFAGKKVALVTVPGALTGTCQNAHIPLWVAKADELRAKGADDVVCLAVNDPFVMAAFEKAVGANGKVRFVGDGDASVTKACGIEFDTGAFGGVRAVRGGFLVEDGVFTQVNLESGGAFDGPSKPEVLLEQM